MTPAARARLVKTLGRSVGFDRVGIVAAGPLPNFAYYRQWLADGHAGEMTYLERQADLRADPRSLLSDARAIVCVAISYRRPQEAPAESPQPTGRVAQYARGRDYHVVVRRLLEQFLTALRRELCEPFEARAFVDSGPLLERQLAAAAGVGWVGKSTLVMNEELGSFLFLGEIVTTLELEPDAPATDHCGTCTRCIEACPTHALTPYRMDASRCVSYLTIEHRGEIAADLAAAMGDWVYGCDICQDVCPHNRKAPSATNAALLEQRIPPRIALESLIELRSGGYRRLTRDSAARRASRPMWIRNARNALKNAGWALPTDSADRAEAASPADAVGRADAVRRAQPAVRADRNHGFPGGPSPGSLPSEWRAEPVLP